MIGETTEAFDAIRCEHGNRYHYCELLRRNSVVDEYNVEEVTVKDYDGGNNVERVKNQAYNDRFSIVLDEPTTAEVAPENANLEIEL